MDVPIEIYQLILFEADFLTQIRMRQINRILYAKLEINNFYHIEQKYSDLLSDQILAPHPFITELNARANQLITNLAHLTRLEKLDTTHSGIDDAAIKNNFALRELYASHNHKIMNVNHLTRLEKLDVFGRCGIDDVGISDLNLKELYATHNSKITNINHLIGLETLIISGFCGLENDGISGLTNLTRLKVSNNPRITDINSLTRLKVLHATGSACELGLEGIVNLDLEEMYIEENWKIVEWLPKGYFYFLDQGITQRMLNEWLSRGPFLG